MLTNPSQILQRIPTGEPAGSPGFALTFLSLTKASARVALAEDGSILITAPARVFKIKPLELLASQCMVAIAAGSRLPLESFSLEVGIQVDPQKFCRAVAAVRSERAINADLVKAVVNQLLSHLKHRESTAALLDEDCKALPDDAMREIVASTDLTLTQLGGTAICCPSAIFLESIQIAEFCGTYAAKPDHSQLQPEIVEFDGRCDGFRVKKRLVFLETEGQSVQAYWESDSALDEIMALASKPSKVHALRLKKSLDRSGQPIFTFLSAASSGTPVV